MPASTVIVRFTGCQRELDRQAVGINNCKLILVVSRPVTGPLTVFCSE